MDPKRGIAKSHAKSSGRFVRGMQRVLKEKEYRLRDSAAQNRLLEGSFLVMSFGGYCFIMRLLVRDLILEQGVDVNSVDSKGRSALHFACCGGYLEVVRFLLDNEADPNGRDINLNAPLHLGAFPRLRSESIVLNGRIAVTSRHFQVVTELLKRQIRSPTERVAR